MQKQNTFLLVADNKVIGTTTTARKPLYENQMCKEVGLIASCNGCDRVIFEDEKWLKQYTSNGGYCSDCKPKYPATKLIEKAIRNVKEYTKCNNHGEAAICFAEFMQDQPAITELKAIQKTQDYRGHALPEEIRRRWEITTKLLNMVEAKYSADVRQKFYSSF